MIKQFEGFLKNYKDRRKMKRNPLHNIQTQLAEWDKARRKLNDKIKELEEHERDIKDMMFNSLPIERQEEIIRRRDELKAKIKEADPYGEEDWNNDIDFDFDIDYIGDINKRYLDEIEKAIKIMKPLETNLDD